MGLEGIMLSEISQIKKEIPHNFNLYVESKEENKQNRNRLIDTETRLMVVRQEGHWRAG